MYHVIDRSHASDIFISLSTATTHILNVISRVSTLYLPVDNLHNVLPSFRNHPLLTFSLTLKTGYTMPAPPRVPSNKSLLVSQLKSAPSVVGRKGLISITLGRRWINGWDYSPPCPLSSLPATRTPTSMLKTPFFQGSLLTACHKTQKDAWLALCGG